MLQVALEYAAKGWKVFPLHGIKNDGECTCGRTACTDAGKHPITANGLKDASSDPAIIEQLFKGADERCNIGIVTGKASQMTVIDIDVGSGKLGAETWSGLIEQHGEPNTLMSKTGSGGMHVFFKYNSALRTGTNRLGKGVDVRNDSGYVVAPPSRHRSGGTYEWLNDTPLEDLPPYLLNAKKDGRGRKKVDDPTRRKYTVDEVKTMLTFIKQDDRDDWRNVGVILGREYARSDEAWAMYSEWSNKWEGKKGRGHEDIMRQAFYEISQDMNVGKELGFGTLIYKAIEGGWAPKDGIIDINLFIYFAEGNNFVYRPTASYWTRQAVNIAVGKVNDGGVMLKASEWIERNVLATSMTCYPGFKGDYLKGFDALRGELIAGKGAAVFNAYRRPSIELGDPLKAEPFIDHVKKVFNKGTDAEQFFDYMAHRVQFPEVKPRFALIIAGEQGVGKDTSVEFCVPAIGSWNVSNIDPVALDGTYNDFANSTLVRINEAANLHEMSKWSFNERMKNLIAGAPDIVRINPKYGKQYDVKMYCGVIITTNHLRSGIYIPADDRRYDVIDSATKEEMGLDSDAKALEYFTKLWDWLHDGGASHVAAFLTYRDISAFSASNGQRKTMAHKSVVGLSYSNDGWLADILAELNEPDVVRADSIMSIVRRDGLNEKDAALKIVPTMARNGYVQYQRNLWLPNNSRKDGRVLYSAEKKLTTIYYKKELSPQQVEDIWPSLKVNF